MPVVAYRGRVCTIYVAGEEMCVATPNLVVALAVQGDRAVLASRKNGVDVMDLDPPLIRPSAHLQPEQNFHRYEGVAATDSAIVGSVDLTPPRSVRSEGRLELIEVDSSSTRRVTTLDVATSRCESLMLDAHDGTAALACGNKVTVTSIRNDAFTDVHTIELNGSITGLVVLAKSDVLVASSQGVYQINVSEERGIRMDVNGGVGVRALARDPIGDHCFVAAEKVDGSLNVSVARYCRDSATRLTRSLVKILPTTRSSYLFAIVADDDEYLVSNGMAGAVRVPRVQPRALYLPFGIVKH